MDFFATESRPAYPSVFGCICMEIGWQYESRHIFFKIWTEFPESMEIATWKNVMIMERRWSYRSLRFACLKPFAGLKYTAIPAWSKKFLKQININLAFEALRKLAIFRYGGFEYEAVDDKWLHKTDEEEEECKKTRKQALTRQQPFKKG